MIGLFRAVTNLFKPHSFPAERIGLTIGQDKYRFEIRQMSDRRVRVLYPRTTGLWNKELRPPVDPSVL